MAHPNALPESKEAYCQAMLSTRLPVRCTQAWDVALVMYHAEVPLHQAQDYLKSFAQSGYPHLRGKPYWFDKALGLLANARPVPPAASIEDLVYLFAACHATDDDSLAALTILAGKLQRH